MTLDDLKLYLRIDNDVTTEDQLLTSMLSAATCYIQRMTGKTKVIIEYDDAGVAVTTDISTNELYNLCIKLLCAHWYENRGVEIAGTLTNITHSVDALVQHISLCGDYV